MSRWMKAACAAAVGLISVVVPMAPASAAPAFQLPFPCGQVWSGQTRTGHSPPNSVDFNRTDDVNDPVVASANGTVVTVRNLGSESYGRFVIIDHGGGWRTYYAHLASFSVSVGDTVASGDRIGTVGTSGGSTGPHLHYEQRKDGVDVRAVFNGSGAYYWGTKSYTSHNACGGTAAATGTVNTSGTPLTVRSGPGTGYRAVRTVADGAKVGIICQTTGTTVTGTYGTSNVWDKITGGGYIADAYVYTGSDGLVAPRC